MLIETRMWPIPPAVPPKYPYSKWNVIRWFGNIEGVDPGYEPTWPQWRRSFFWFFRNFAYNFFRFVVGLEDKVIMVTGDTPVFTTTWYDDDPKHYGLKRAIILYNGWAYKFISYSGKYVVWYFGWLPSGGRFGAKFNLVSHG